MSRRSSFTKPHTIDLRGVLGTFKVPHAKLTVEYVLTYASLDASQAAYGQLLDLLVPVREVFELEGLSFDQLLQRDLDDFRVSNEMVPYLLGDEPSDPRFFPPIVSVIVPMSNGKMDNKYPACKPETENEGSFKLQTSKYGNVFSVKREISEDGELARSPVDLIIHPTNAKLVIVDGQHRAMAMLATYRSAFNKWSGNPFKYFYEGLGDLEAGDKSSMFSNILLPVCIVYFPELTKDKSISPSDMDLTKACRRLFLDVNRNARQPSQARQILLDDTDLAAFFTRFIFNKFQQNTKVGSIKLQHTEYDNPHDRAFIYRPFALTDVYTIFTIVMNTLMLDEDRVRNPISSGGKQPQNKLRLRRELEVEDAFTQEEIENLNLQLADIKRYNYPRHLEEKLGKCFEDGWGEVIVSTLGKLYPFSKHIEAVNTVLKQNHPYTGPNDIAHTALTEGQGLRFTLDKQQEHDKKYRRTHKIAERTDAEKAWEALSKLEEEVEVRRAKLYLSIKKGDPTSQQVSKVNRVFTCFRTSAFQTGLFMALAFLKGKLSLDNQQFTKQAERWVERINKRFQNDEKIRTVLFDIQEPTSLRRIYKPSGGLVPADWTFFRYIILELLNQGTGKEKRITSDAITKWRGNLYQNLVNRKVRELGEDNEVDSENLALADMVSAYKGSLGVTKSSLKEDIDIATDEIEDTDELVTLETDEEEYEDET